MADHAPPTRDDFIARTLRLGKMTMGELIAEAEAAARLRVEVEELRRTIEAWRPVVTAALRWHVGPEYSSNVDIDAYNRVDMALHAACDAIPPDLRPKEEP